MSTATEDKIFAKLDAMSTQLTEFATRQTITAELVAATAIEVRGISLHGCALAATHSDHETRIRGIESKVTAGMAISGIVGTGIGAVVAWLWEIIKSKHAGSG